MSCEARLLPTVLSESAASSMAGASPFRLFHALSHRRRSLTNPLAGPNDSPSDTMNVLHLDSGLAFRGGNNKSSSWLLGLARVGVEQQLVLRSGSVFERRAAEANLPFTTLPFRSEGDLISALQLRTVIRRFQPQIVHAHDARTLGLAALTWAMGTRSRIIAARRVAFPLRRNPLTAMKYRSVAQRIIAVSQYVRDLLVASGVEERRVDVVYDGVDLNRVSQRSDSRQGLGVEAEACLIGCVGQFVAEKGHEFLIRAFARIRQVIPPAMLVLIGDGELKGEYRMLVQQLGLEGKVLFQDSSPISDRCCRRWTCLCSRLFMKAWDQVCWPPWLARFPSAQAGPAAFQRLSRMA